MSLNELVGSLTAQELAVAGGLVFFAIFFLGLVIRSWFLTQLLNERAARTEASNRLERAKPAVVSSKPVRAALRKPIPAVRSAVPAPRNHRYNGSNGRARSS
ncbi:hypothetical protein [Parvibaculum sp. MBR-TMA-1.3b-4.2]|jgi:hypothetical protein